MGNRHIDGSIYTFTAFMDSLEHHPLHGQTQTANSKDKEIQKDWKMLSVISG